MSDFSDLLGSAPESETEGLTTPATATSQPKSAFRSLLEQPDAPDPGPNLLGAATTTPDAHQKNLDIGRRIGSPADAVAGSREAEQLARVQRYREALNDAPRLARLLAEDPDLAKISADDLEVLGKTERTLSFLGSVGRGVDLLQSNVFGFAEATGEATGMDALTALGRAGRLRNIAEAQQYGDRSRLFDIGSVGEAGQYAKETVGEQLPMMAPGLAGGLGGGAAGFAVAGPPGAAIGAIIGAFIPSFVLGVGETQGSIKEKDEDVAAPGYAFGAGTLIGILDSALPGKVGTMLVKALGREATEQVLALTGRRLAADTAKGATLEGVTEAVQEVIGEVAASQATGQEIDARSLAEQTVEAFVAGFGMGGGAQGGAAVVSAIGRNRDRAARAVQDQAVIESLVKGTADSKLRDRNPDAFSQVMAAQTKGTPIETFYLPADRLAELYQERGAAPFAMSDDPLDQIEGLREQFQEALAVGGDVEISAADYLTYVAPSDLHGALKNDLRASRDGWSVNDAKQYSENPDRETRLQKLVEDLAIANEGAKVGQRTFDSVYQQLMDTGRYEAHQAAAQAALVRERYLTRAARLGGGQDADALYLDDQVKIFGPGALARVRRDDLDLVIARLKSGETVTAAKSPVLDIVRQKGGVRVGSQLDSELRAMGINPKTHPGLFKAKGGIGDVDNWVLAEHDVLRDNGVQPDASGYADRDAVLEALRAEAGGRGTAMLTQDERQQAARLDEPVAVLAEQLEAAGLDPAKMTADEIAAWVRGQKRPGADVAPNAQGVLLQGPVATLTGEEIAPFGADIKTLRAAAQVLWKKSIKGTSVKHPTLGTIEFTAKGERKFFASSANPDKLRLTAALPDIVGNATLVRTDPALPKGPNDNVVAYHWLEADVRLGSRLLRVGVTVFEDNKGDKFYNLNAAPETPDGAQRSGQIKGGGNAPSAGGPAPAARSGPADEAGGGTTGGGASIPDMGAATDGINITVGDVPSGPELYQSVYHGSPHVFDKFSTSAIGSGEGAQAFGFGLYFASKKEIAKHYRETLGGADRYLIDGVDAATQGPFLHALARSIAEGRRSLDDILGKGQEENRAWAEAGDTEAERARRRRISDERMEAARSLAGKEITKVPGGRLYTVEIPDDGEYLLYDKPLSEQPEAVRKALQDPFVQAAIEQQKEGVSNPDPETWTGEILYGALRGYFADIQDMPWGETPRAASDALLAAGVRGIKYLDASARDTTGDSFNYVLFADADAVITAYEQRARQGGGVRGSFLPKRAQDPHGDPANIVRLTAGADLSTALHEFGHFFLFQLVDDATGPGATPEARAALQADLQAVLDHVGIKIDVSKSTPEQIHAAMTREAHELWARSFEVYLREGKAPSAALKDAFASFAAWLVRIYRQLRNIPDYRRSLTPEVRGVMDRLLATDEAIADAARASSFRVPSSLRSVMTAAEQRSLERLTEQANREAREELQVRVMRELARERTVWWNEEREKVRATVEAEVRARPAYRAYNILRTGTTPDGQQLVDENGEPRVPKLGRAALIQDYGRDVLRLLPKGVTAAKDGISHHVFAGMVGLGSADQLRDALMNLRPIKEVIEEETDAAMKQRHGDMLADGTIAEDAAELVLNEKQLELAALQAKALRRLAASLMEKAGARTVAQAGAPSAASDRARVAEASADVEAVAQTGIPAEGVAGVSAEEEFARATAAAGTGQRTAQRAALRQVRGIRSGLDLKAIEAAARKAIASKTVSDARPDKYRAQAARLVQRIEDAISKRDYETAATLKEQQLINLALAREAQAVQAQVEKATKRFARLRKPDSKLGKTVDVDFVGAARAILSQFGLSSPQVGFDQQVWFQKLAEQDPVGAQEMRDMIDAATAGAGTVAARGRVRTRQKPGGAPVPMGDIWRQMTVDEFRSLVDTVDGMLAMGRAARSVELGGERLEIKAAVGELVAQASGRDKGERIGQTSAVTWKQGMAVKFLGISAALERMETWARRMDDGKVGPYTKYFIRPVLAAVYEYREAKGKHVKQLVDLLEPRRKELYGRTIHSDDLNYTFKNKAALLHAVLHSGNDSNFRKLLLGGRGKGAAWGRLRPDGSLDTSRWDDMVRAMVRDGHLTKADYDLVQSIWDMLEATKGPAQIAHRKMKGFYFPEVEVTGIDTPFGRYRGGYVPAITDRLLNADRAAQADADAMGDLSNAGMLPSVARGFTKARVEYNQPLELNLALLPSHVDKVLKFTHLGPVVRNVTRLAIDRDFKEVMHGVDPTILNNLVLPWLHRVARQTLETPSTTEAGRTTDHWFRLLRRNTGMQAMAGNIVNALQQVTGLSTAMVRVRPGFLLRGLVTAVKAPRLSVEEMKRLSPLMRERMDGATQDMMHNLDEILSDKWVGFRMVDRANRHGYFAQVFMQNIVDRIVWSGAYEQATAAGKDEKEAALDADGVVRTTQGSFSPEDASKFESQPGFIRGFTLFYSYFNGQMNLLRSEAEISVRESGWGGASPRLFFVYVVGAMIPAVLAETIVQTAKGELGDDEDDGLWDDIAELFALSQLRYFAAMVPGIGAGVTYGINLANSKPYDDRLSTSPVFSSLETIGRTFVQHVPDVLTGEGLSARAIRDALTTIGMLTGLPLGQLGKPLGYIADVMSGEQSGESLGDWARGLLSGREEPRQ